MIDARPKVPEIVLVPLPGRKWRVQDEFAIFTKIAGRIVIPKGFICDLNSIPRFMWWESTPTDFPQAGATHDWLYDRQVPQELADGVYREILIALNMSEFRANLRWRALRIFGGPAYRSHARG